MTNKNVSKFQINAVPQFQGAVTKRAEKLPEGCVSLAELAGRVLDKPVNYVDQERSTSPIVDGVANRAVLLTNLKAQQQALAGVEQPVLTIGGDCGIEFAAISAVRKRYGPGLGVAWFDAHADLNTPEDHTTTGAYHAMVLRGLLGEGDPALSVSASEALDPKRVALINVRSSDAADRVAMKKGLGVITADPAGLLRDVTDIYIHVDVDVLDPSEFEGLNMPEGGGGMRISELITSLDSLRGFNVVGAGMTECAGTPEQVEVLTPLVAKIGELMGPATP